MTTPLHRPLAEFRFYEELNDFLPAARRKHSFVHAFDGTPAVKDVVESLGVPHTEIDLILVDGTSVRFGHRLRGGERVAVYPMFERFDVRLLKRSCITRGHWVRSTDPQSQLEEVVRAFSLQRESRPFSRCTACNGELRSIERAAVVGRVPQRVHARYRAFVECAHCGRIYWRGSHYRRLERLARAARGRGA